MNLGKNMFIPILITMLILSACYSQADKLKGEAVERMQQAVQSDPNTVHGHLSFSGHFLESSSRMESDWTWYGLLSSADPVLLWEGLRPQGAEKASLLFAEDQMYVHIPELNRKDEYFTVSAPFPATPFALKPYMDAVTAMPKEAFTETVDENGTRTISIRIGENEVETWLNALHKSVIDLPPAVLTVLFPDSGDAHSDWFNDTGWAKDGAFEMVFNDAGVIDTYALKLYTTRFDVEWNQTFSPSNFDSSAFLAPERSKTVPLEDVWAQLKHIMGDMSHSDNETFEPGLFLNDAEYDPERQNIIEVIKKSLEALINRDREQFDAVFRRPAFSQRHDELWNRERKYRFLHIEDLSQKSLQGSVRVSVLYEYMEPGDENATLSGLIFILNRDDNGSWKIDRID